MYDNSIIIVYMFEMLVDRDRSERWTGEPTDRGVDRSLINRVTRSTDVLLSFR